MDNNEHTGRNNTGRREPNRRFRFDINHAPFDFIFILVLLCIFAFGALMTASLGSNIYKGIKGDMDSNFEFRTPLSYIATKVRQNDRIDSIRIINKEGTGALVLEAPDNGVTCETWIYEYQGFLYEVYLEKGTPFHLEDGLAMIPSHGLEFKLKGNLLQITASDHKGKTRSLSLSFRTDQGGGF